MLRPVRPVALVILTACMLYPGVGLLYQGLYPFVAGDWFNLVGQQGPWMDLARKFGLPLVAGLAFYDRLVDALLDEHQVVIKSIETNYRKVAGTAGATILGDGRVALILDVNALLQMRNNQAELS